MSVIDNYSVNVGVTSATASFAVTYSVILPLPPSFVYNILVQALPANTTLPF